MSFPHWKSWVKGTHFGLEGLGCCGDSATGALGWGTLPLLPFPCPSSSLQEKRGTQPSASWELREASQEAFAISTERKALSSPPGDLSKTWPCPGRHASFYPIS